MNTPNFSVLSCSRAIAKAVCCEGLGVVIRATCMDDVRDAVRRTECIMGGLAALQRCRLGSGAAIVGVIAVWLAARRDRTSCSIRLLPSVCSRYVSTVFFFFKQKTAYEITR